MRPAAACNGVPGLCGVPVRSATWLGTHNSLAIASELACPLRRQFSNQAAPVLSQLAAGARVLNIDADLRAGRVIFGHGLCANARTTPAVLFDQLGGWLAAHPGETLVLHFDDNGQKDNADVAASMRDQVMSLMAASPLGPFVRSEAVGRDTLMSDVRGKAVVVFDAPQWGGGGAATSSRGVWLKAWGEASSDRLYATDPARAAATRDEVSRQLLARFSSGAWGSQGARCGADVPFRSFSFGSGDWQVSSLFERGGHPCTHYSCAAVLPRVRRGWAGARAARVTPAELGGNQHFTLLNPPRSLPVPPPPGPQQCLPGVDVSTCQLPLLANATNDYGHLAATLRETAEACGAPAGPPGVNVLFLDFFPPQEGAAAAAASAAPSGPVQLVRDLNRAAVVKFQGCSWGAAGGGSSSSSGGGSSGSRSGALTCPGIEALDLEAAAAAPAAAVAQADAPAVAAQRGQAAPDAVTRGSGDGTTQASQAAGGGALVVASAAPGSANRSSSPTGAAPAAAVASNAGAPGPTSLRLAVSATAIALTAAALAL
jgi:hypothetical protein